MGDRLLGALNQRFRGLGPAIVAFAALGAAVPASAEKATDPVAEALIQNPLAMAASGETERVIIRAGRALDLEGKPVFAGRSNFSGTASMTIFSTRPIPTLSPRSSSYGATIAPLARGAVSSGFGMRTHPLLGNRRFHAGVDIAAPTGSPIRATSDGMVTTAGWQGGYGLLVSIGHGAGQESRYGHLSRIAVTSGQAVKQGDVIGFVGTTGRSTGPHLHYEQRVNGRAVRPHIRPSN